MCQRGEKVRISRYTRHNPHLPNGKSQRENGAVLLGEHPNPHNPFMWAESGKL